MRNMPVFVLACLAMLAAAPAGATVYTAPMTGAQETPPNASPATGFSIVTVEGDLMTVEVDWDGLIGGPATAAHIHCCAPPEDAAGIAVGLPGFPAAESGFYLESFDLLDAAIYDLNFLNTSGGGTAEGARDALVAGLDAGLAYTNIHNADFPAGEIRGNLTAVADVPEPATLLMLAGGLALAAVGRRRTGRT